MPTTTLTTYRSSKQRKLVLRLCCLLDGSNYISVGLMFFGTPHKGGNRPLVNLGSLAARIATSLGFREHSDLVSTLQQGSVFSDILQETFRNQLSLYRIVSFYEKKGNVGHKS